MSTHTSGCKDVITCANMSELYFVACVLIRYLTSVFVLRKDLHIPHESIVQGEGRFVRVTERSVVHKNNTLLLPSCSSVPLFIWHCAGGLPGCGVVLGAEDEELWWGGCQWVMRRMRVGVFTSPLQACGP